jgi:EpsI family protein
MVYNGFAADWLLPVRAEKDVSVNFLRNRYTQAVTVLLLLQAAAFYAVASRKEIIPSVPPLANFPVIVGPWYMTQDVPLDKDTLDILRADDTLNRVYVNPANRELATVYIAYFKTQRTGQSPHSPKNCLPGSGWEPIDVGLATLKVSGWDTPITVNRYVVRHGEDKSVVYYWYQSHERVIAKEYAAKFWLVMDSIRYRQSATALVRVIAPVRNNDVEQASRVGEDFVRALFPQIRTRLRL